MAALQCPACGKIYGSHFARCIHCNAPRPDGAEPPVAPPVSVAAASAPAAVPRPPRPPGPECPCCGDAPGSGRIRLEKREYRGLTLLMRRRYLVRWVDIGGVCRRCLHSLEAKRYLADVLVNVPFILLAVIAIAMESKAFLMLLGIYTLIVLKWSWGLGYLWADDLLYGRVLSDRLSRFEPPGDEGTARLPAGLWHCLVRLGAIPACLTGLLLVAFLFVPRPAPGRDGSGVEVPEATRAYLKVARNLAVPVDPRSLAMEKIDVPGTDYADFIAYVDASKLNSGRSYQLMTGPQLLSTFIKSPARPGDVLFIEGTSLKGILRREAPALAASLPAEVPPATPPLRRP